MSVDRVPPAGSQRRVGRGAVLFEQGQTFDWSLLITAGVVAVRRLTAEGRLVLIDVAGAGDVLGRIDASDTAPCDEQAVALGDVTYLAFRPGSADAPVPPAQIIASLVQRDRRRNDRMVVAVTEPVERRLERLLCELALLQAMPCTHGLALEVLLSQSEIADLVGASRPVINQALSRLKSQGKLDFNARQVCVHSTLLAECGRAADNSRHQVLASEQTSAR
jgi:CRP/FNR family transcriptional regulator, cyclic AMP receptor protein